MNHSFCINQNDVRVEYLVSIITKSVAKWEIILKMIGFEIDALHSYWHGSGLDTGDRIE